MSPYQFIGRNKNGLNNLKIFSSLIPGFWSRRKIYGLLFLFMSVRSSLFLSFMSSDLSALSFMSSDLSALSFFT
ncbi:hypothetical protein FH589_13055 [Leptospira interrogans]|nr:hypothetical protein [Leptospira interrogans]UML67874.1 hypothetical protein FH589_13055 [Leptospira interrogans]